MSEITFHVEPWTTFKVEAAYLWPKHWQEIALNQDAIKLSVDYDMVDKIAEQGRMLIVVAREEEKVIGYWVGLLAYHLHYKESLTANTDIFYVRQESRRDVFLLQKMLKFVMTELKARGVERLMIASKCHKDLSRIFERMQMTRTEVVYSKLLKD